MFCKWNDVKSFLNFCLFHFHLCRSMFKSVLFCRLQSKISWSHKKMSNIAASQPKQMYVKYFDPNIYWVLWWLYHFCSSLDNTWYSTFFFEFCSTNFFMHDLNNARPHDVYLFYHYFLFNDAVLFPANMMTGWYIYKSVKCAWTSYSHSIIIKK